MISSHRLFRAISFVLEQNLKGAYFSHGISFDKDSLHLHFIHGKKQIAYEVKFLDGELCLSSANWTDIKSKLKSNAVVQFKELENQLVDSIEFGLLDRVVKIQFRSGMFLVLKGYGKFGNVLLFENQSTTPLQLFRLNYKKDWELNFQQIKTIWLKSDCSDEDMPYFENAQLWDAQIKSIGSQELLKTKVNYFELSKRDKQRFLHEFIDPLKTNIYWDDMAKKIAWNGLNNLLSLPPQAFIEQYEQVIRIYYRWFFVERERELLIELTQKHQKQYLNRVATYQKRIKEIESQRSFKEIGDLILGHAHSIRKGTSEALITDFFTGQRIRLKINPDLSAAENAEKCYRKAKNQHLELENLKQQLEIADQNLSQWKEIGLQLQSAETGKDFKAIRKLIPEERSKENKNHELHSKPYKRIILDTYEVWIGKNAKSNEAVLKEAHKNDIWMHAADVTGSHVIIRTLGKPVAKQTLEKVASLCAFHSKGKSQTLQTVMFTERKLVSKSKNAALGEVKVSKFSTIDVVPKNFQGDT